MRGPAASTARDRHPLLLAAGEVLQGAAAQLGQAEQVEGLLDPASHGGGLDAHRLHAVGDLLLDGVGDERGDRVLHDHTDEVGEVAGAVRAGVPAGDHDRAAQPAAGEVRHQPVDAPQQRRLPAAGGADDQDQLALGDGEVDVREAVAVVALEPDARRRGTRS